MKIQYFTQISPLFPKKGKSFYFLGTNQLSFKLYFKFQVLGNQILEQIEERASANAWPSVLMVSSSIKRLSVTCGPSQSAIVTSTPGQLAKHMITNASFRTKKISDDIPKVLTDDENGPTSNAATSAARMKSIVEEIATDDSNELTSPPSSSGKPSFGGKLSNNNGEGKPHTSNKEKLMAKLPNLKVSMTSKKERTHSETNDRETSGDKDEKKSGKGDKSAAEKFAKSEKKKSGKLYVTSSLAPGSTLPGNGGGGSSPSPTSLNSGVAFGRSQNGDGVSISSKNIESISIEQVEELIQMKKLPQETISIHSPESGTTLF
jgi:hypothetical protein